MSNQGGPDDRKPIGQSPMPYGQQMTPAGLSAQQMSGVRGMPNYGPMPGPMMGRMANPGAPPSMVLNQPQGVAMADTVKCENPGPTPPSQGASQQHHQQQQQQPQAQKELNTASLCRLGQEAVQDIISKATELFQQLKTLQLPTSNPQTIKMQKEKKEKIQEHLNNISLLFRRLRLIYDKCNENCAGMEYTHIESLIPIKDEVDARPEERKLTEVMKFVSDEHRVIAEEVVQKSKHMKEIIDHLRNIIWEMTTMLATRKP